MEPGCRLAGSAPLAARSRDFSPLLSNELGAAAAIKEVVMSPTRSSPRLADAPDQHILERAKLRVAWKNLDREVRNMNYWIMMRMRITILRTSPLATYVVISWRRSWMKTVIT
nr:unnamed protein product [Digitaria exilis]